MVVVGRSRRVDLPVIASGLPATSDRSVDAGAIAGSGRWRQGGCVPVGHREANKPVRSSNVGLAATMLWPRSWRQPGGVDAGPDAPSNTPCNRAGALVVLIVEDDPVFAVPIRGYVPDAQRLHL